MDYLKDSNTSKTKTSVEDEEDKESIFSGSSSHHSKSRSRSRHRDNSNEKYSPRINRFDKERENESPKARVEDSPRVEGEENEEKAFIMKNGCCRECMRAFSKTGKSCLCQVPKFERNYGLPEKGCNFCGCQGKFKILIYF